MDWKKVNLHGSGSISKICAEYEIGDTRLPAAKYKIKVFEHKNEFSASPNVAVKAADGSPDWIGGHGSTEVEALQNALANMGEQFATRARWSESDLEWSDPTDF